MTTLPVSISATASLGRGNRVPPGRALEIAAAIAAMGLLIVAAVLPDDHDDSEAVTISPPSAYDTSGRETVFGAYLGAPYHYPSDFHVRNAEKRTDLTIKDVEWYTHPFNNPLYYGARVQRWREGGRFGTMIDFTHSKAYAPMDQERKFEGTIEGNSAPAAAKPKDFFDKLEWSHGHNMLTLNGLMRLANFGHFSPYVGIGAGVSLPHSEIHLKSDPARTYEYQYTGPIGQALFGVEFKLKTGSVFVEYKFTTTDYWGPLTFRDGTWFPIDIWRQVWRWWSGEEPPGGWAGAKLTSHQVIGGFLTRVKPIGAK